MKILAVEDDRLLNNTLCYNLSAAGYDAAALTKTLQKCQTFEIFLRFERYNTRYERRAI